MRTLLVVSLACAALAGCASRAAVTRPPVPAANASPVSADTAGAIPDTAGTHRDTTAVHRDTTAVHPSPPRTAPAPEPTPDTPPPPVESVIAPGERRQTMARIVADTTAAGSAVRRCAGRRLLPDQESVFDTALSLLGQARTALERDELWRAESLARKARQLAASLNCPG